MSKNFIIFLNMQSSYYYWYIIDRGMQVLHVTTIEIIKRKEEHTQFGTLYFFVTNTLIQAERDKCYAEPHIRLNTF